jgi:hypothetical protein
VSLGRRTIASNSICIAGNKAFGPREQDRIYEAAGVFLLKKRVTRQIRALVGRESKVSIVVADTFRFLSFLGHDRSPECLHGV